MFDGAPPGQVELTAISGLIGVTAAVAKLFSSLNGLSTRFGSFERTPARLTSGMLASAFALTVADSNLCGGGNHASQQG